MNPYPDLIPTALKMIAALGIVLAGIMAVLYFIKRISQGRITGSGHRLIKLIDTNYIGDKKNITMVEVAGEILVLGISSDHIRLLSKIDNPEAVKRINDRMEVVSDATFMDHLQKLTSKFRKSGDEE